MTPEQLSEIRSRHEKATPGEWLPAQDGEYRYASIKGEERPGHKGDGSHRTMPPPGVRFTGENADFIAHAHQDIPALLSHIEELEARLESVRKVLDFNGPADAYHNLGGAIIDIEHDELGVADAVSLRTLKRVEDQIGEVRSIISPVTPPTRSTPTHGDGT